MIVLKVYIEHQNRFILRDTKKCTLYDFCMMYESFKLGRGIIKNNIYTDTYYFIARRAHYIIKQVKE